MSGEVLLEGVLYPAWLGFYTFHLFFLVRVMDPEPIPGTMAARLEYTLDSYAHTVYTHTKIHTQIKTMACFLRWKEPGEPGGNLDAQREANSQTRF